MPQEMRYLKQKIAKANEYQNLRQASESVKKQEESMSQVKIEIPYESIIHESCFQKRKPKRSLGNNVMKNYAGAMIHFARSRLAEPYISRSPLIQEMPRQTFWQILRSKRKSTTCIKSFRELLLVESSDSQETRNFKCLFQELCQVFLKYFSVNWIYHSRLNDKSKYLKYRMRLLRRVQNPEQFTYLETFVKRDSDDKRKRSRNFAEEDFILINQKKEEDY